MTEAFILAGMFINNENIGLTKKFSHSAINEAARIETDAELMIETFSPKAPSNLTANSSRYECANLK